MLATSNLHSQPYRDQSRSLNERVRDLLGRMTLAEKVSQMRMSDVSPLISEGESQIDGGVTIESLAGRLGPNGIGAVQDAQCGKPLSSRRSAEIVNTVQEYLTKHTRLGIPAMVVSECLHGHRAYGATVFPQSIGLASTWNPPLAFEMAQAIAREARSVGVAQALAPDLDLARDARWGRVEETYGEDPYLVERFGVAYVRGMQGEGPDINREHLICTLKHFAGHGTPEGGVNLGPVSGGEHELRSLHLLPFEAAVRDAGAVSVMPAYSEYDGVPAHASNLLLTRILREEWGFEGYVFSDFGGVRMLHSLHHVAATVAEAGRQGLAAGVDLEAPAAESYGDGLLELVEKGLIPVEWIDRAVGRILRAKFLAGLFENPFADPDGAARIVNCSHHRDLARRIAAESIVLLKNEGHLLPLSLANNSESPSIRRIAVLGPNADVAQLGDYAFCKSEAVSPLDGIRFAVPPDVEVLHARGCSMFNASPDGLSEAVEIARQSDVAIVCVGGTSHFNAGVGWGSDGAKATCGEGFDLSDLSLTGGQEALVRAVHQTGTPTVVVLIDGRPNAIPWIAEHVPAILAAWYPGEQGGHALADVLFGRINPSGKLPISFPRSAGHVPCYYNHKPSARGFYKEPGTPSNPGRDYVFSATNALFEFGHGLSYTTFDYTDLRITPHVIAVDGETRVSVSVTNTGSHAGHEVVQLYVRDLYSSVTTPVKSLKGFEKIRLDAGQRADVHFTLGPKELRLLDAELNWKVEPGDFEIYVGPLRGRFTVAERGQTSGNE